MTDFRYHYQVFVSINPAKHNKWFKNTFFAMVKSIFAIVYHLCNCIYFIYLTRIIADLDLYILSLGRRYNTFSHNVTGEQRKRSLLRHAVVNSLVSRFVMFALVSVLSPAVENKTTGADQERG